MFLPTTDGLLHAHDRQQRSIPFLVSPAQLGPSSSHSVERNASSDSTTATAASLKALQRQQDYVHVATVSAVSAIEDTVLHADRRSHHGDDASSLSSGGLAGAAAIIAAALHKSAAAVGAYWHGAHLSTGEQPREGLVHGRARSIAALRLSAEVMAHTLAAPPPPQPQQGQPACASVSLLLAASPAAFDKAVARAAVVMLRKTEGYHRQQADPLPQAVDDTLPAAVSVCRSFRRHVDRRRLFVYCCERGNGFGASSDAAFASASGRAAVLVDGLHPDMLRDPTIQLDDFDFFSDRLGRVSRDEEVVEEHGSGTTGPPGPQPAGSEDAGAGDVDAVMSNMAAGAAGGSLDDAAEALAALGVLPLRKHRLAPFWPSVQGYDDGTVTGIGSTRDRLRASAMQLLNRLKATRSPSASLAGGIGKDDADGDSGVGSHEALRRRAPLGDLDLPLLLPAEGIEQEASTSIPVPQQPSVSRRGPISMPPVRTGSSVRRLAHSPERSSPQRNSSSLRDIVKASTLGGAARGIVRTGQEDVTPTEEEPASIHIIMEAKECTKEAAEDDECEQEGRSRGDEGPVAAFDEAFRRRFFALETPLFLNSGSYGATPKCVLRARCMWELLEQRNPTWWRLGYPYCPSPYLRRTANDNTVNGDISTQSPAPTALTQPQRGSPMLHHLKRVRNLLSCELRTHPANTALLVNCNAALSTVIKSQPWEAGDVFFMLSCDYDASFLQVEFLRDRHGVVPYVLALAPPLSDEVVCQRLNEALSLMALGLPSADFPGLPLKLPRLVNFCHVTSRTGWIFPVRAMTAICHRFGVLVCIDGAQAVGHLHVDVPRIGADFYMGTGHKWLYTCPGTAILVVAPAVQPLVQPLTPAVDCGDGSGGSGDPTPHSRPSTFEERFARAIPHYDANTFLAIAQSFGFLNTVCGGMDRVRRHCETLAARAVEHLTKAWGLRSEGLLSPHDPRHRTQRPRRHDPTKDKIYGCVDEHTGAIPDPLSIRALLAEEYEGASGTALKARTGVDALRGKPMSCLPLVPLPRSRGCTKTDAVKLMGYLLAHGITTMIVVLEEEEEDADAETEHGDESRVGGGGPRARESPLRATSPSTQPRRHEANRNTSPQHSPTSSPTDNDDDGFEHVHHTTIPRRRRRSHQRRDNRSGNKGGRQDVHMADDDDSESGSSGGGSTYLAVRLSCSLVVSFDQIRHLGRVIRELDGSYGALTLLREYFPSFS